MRVRFLASVLLLALSPALEAAVFTVTNNNDAGAGSLRQAILDANATPGRDVIEFAAGVSTIDSSTPAITDPVVIDGRTAPLYVPGGTPAIHVIGRFWVFYVQADDVEIHAVKMTKGYSALIIWTGSNGRLTGCHMVNEAGVRFVGIQLSGGATGNTIGGTDPAERNTIWGMRTAAIYVENASGNVIEGNLIGNEATEPSQLRNGYGIFIRNSDATVVRGNAITRNAQVAVLLRDSVGTRIHGNTIANNGSSGIAGGDSVDVRDNVIVGNTRGIVAAGTHSVILGNVFDANRSLAIDLGGDDVTPNDPGDADSKQNFPDLSLATSALISGTLHSVPSTSFRVELFASSTADPSGFGEGEAFLGSTEVATDTAGNAVFSLAAPAYPTTARYVTATATRLNPDLTPMRTSEFSAALTITPDIGIAGAAQSEGNSGMTAFSFPVILSRPSAVDVSASYSTSDGTASTADGDYAPASGTLVIPAGETTGTIAVAVSGDTKFELDESFVVTLSTPVNGTITTAEGTGVIVNDDAPPAISINDASGSEASGSLTFTLTLSSPSGLPVSVTAQTLDGTAAAGSDYTAAGPVALSFAPGTTSQSFIVPLLDDAIDEPDEFFNVILSNPSNATLPIAQATGTITDDDDPPVIAIADVSGTESSGSLTFTLTLSNASALPVSVTAQTADGTAIAGSDYTAAGPTVVSFAPGSTSQTFTVPLIDDVISETTETFVVTLTDPVNATLAHTQAEATILDDDGVPSIAISGVSGTESSGSLTFTLTLSNASALPVSVTAQTADGTAIAGSDYTATGPAILSFDPGVISQSLTVPLLDDVISETTETFVVTLTDPVNATLAHTQAEATILDDDGVPSIAISGVSGTESSGSLTFTLTLSNASALPVSVTAQTADGTAIAGSDYTAAGPTVVSFAPGSTSQTFTIPLIDDVISETTETFVVTLTDPVNATLAATSATGTIEDDEGPLTLSIENWTGADTGPAVFTITLSGPAAFPVTVDFATDDETAIAGTHYTASAGTVTFTAGVTTQTITIPLLIAPASGTRTFLLTLSNATGATLAIAEARATISGTVAVPTLSQWMLLFLLTTIGITGAVMLRKT